MHYIGMNTFLESIFQLILGMMKEKIQDRISFHTTDDMKSLYEAVGTDILPEEYGGTNGVIQDHIGKCVFISLEKLVRGALPMY